VETRKKASPDDLEKLMSSGDNEFQTGRGLTHSECAFIAKVGSAVSGHLDSAVDQAQFNKNLMSLPVNREQAWLALTPTRQQAISSWSVNGAVAAYEERFLNSLAELQTMFEEPHWRHARCYGGNAWARIASLTLDFVEALVSNDETQANSCAAQLMTAKHNNGTVLHKLERLKALEKGAASSEDQHIE
jgi:hypothetical protein